MQTLISFWNAVYICSCSLSHFPVHMCSSWLRTYNTYMRLLWKIYVRWAPYVCLGAHVCRAPCSLQHPAFPACCFPVVHKHRYVRQWRQDREQLPQFHKAQTQLATPRVAACWTSSKWICAFFCSSCCLSYSDCLIWSFFTLFPLNISPQYEQCIF